MAGLVDQLQSDALDHTVPVSTLLRKVKVCAAKLGLDDALSWVEEELSGYTGPASELPDYRQSIGTTMAQDQYARWVPFGIAESNFADSVAEVHFREPVSSYEAMLATESSTFDLPIDNELVRLLNQTFNVNMVAMRNKVSRGHLVRIVEEVRTLVLDWA